MAIPVQRFTSLDTEFNVATSSIKNSDVSQILNSASNSISSLTSFVLNAVSGMSGQLGVNSLIGSVIQAKNGLESALGLTKVLGSIAKAEQAIREVRGVMQSSVNTDLFSSKQIDALFTSIFKNDPVVRQIMAIQNADLGNKLAANVTLGNPYSPQIQLSPTATPPPGSSVKVSVGSSQYNYSGIVQVLNRVTGNTSSSNANYPQTPIDYNTLLRQTVMIANLAYDANLTNILSTLKNTPGMTPDLFARITAIVMTEQATKGNAAAVIDMANSGTGVVGNENSPIHTSPAIITDTLANFKLPPGSTESNSESLASALITSISMLDPTWDISDYDGIPSTKHLESASTDLLSALEAKAVDNTFTETNLTVTFGSVDENIIVAMLANDGTSALFMRQLARDTNCCRQILNC